MTGDRKWHPVHETSGRSGVEIFLGDSPSSRHLWRDARLFAKTPYPVLLVGPTGSGKTVLAREIHELSHVAAGPFVDFSLASLADELRAAELSGSVRGAYTGSVGDRVGVVEAANKGTLFLDETGHASLNVQRTLLTILESGCIRRVGEVRTRPASVRFIFASSVDLAELVDSGDFLDELRNRIAVLTIRLPALKDRSADILPLAKRFFNESVADLRKSTSCQFAEELNAFLESWPWPGNLRELRSVCRYLAVRVETDRAITCDDLPDHMLASVPHHAPQSRHGDVLEALSRAGGNKSKAARVLGVSRTSFYRMLDGP